MRDQALGAALGRLADLYASGQLTEARAFLSDLQSEIGQQTFRDYALKEWAQWADGGRRTKRKIAIPLIATIDSDTTNSEGTDTWTALSDEVAFWEEVRGTLRVNDWSGESLAMSAIGNPGVRDRLLVKASNCRIKLEDVDDSLPLVQTGTNEATIALADILPAIGGKPLPYLVPELFPPGHKIKMTATLQDTASDIIGAETEYGVVLIGTAVRLPRR